MRGYWILAIGPSRPRPGNTPALLCSWYTPWVRRISRFSLPCHDECSPLFKPGAGSSFQFTAPRPCPPHDAPAETIPGIPRNRRCGTPQLAEGPASGNRSYSRRKGSSLRSPTSKSTHLLPSTSLTTAVQIQQSSRLPPCRAPRQVHISSQDTATAGLPPCRPLPAPFPQAAQGLLPLFSTHPCTAAAL